MGACCGAPYMDGVFKLKGARYNLKMVDIGKIEPAAKSASANPQLGEVDSDGFDSSVDLDDMRGGRLSTGELLDMDSDESGADLWTPKGRRRSAQKVQDKMHRWMNSLSGRNLGQEVSQEVAVKCRDRTNNMLMLFDLRGSQRHITNYYHKVEFIGEGHYGSVAKWRRNDTPMRQSSTPLSERQENADPDVDTEDDEIEDVGQVVAVKTLTWKRISNSFFRDAKKENNIRNELKMLLMLDHPFIIKFREWFEDPCAGIHFVMEFCDGCSLQKILDDICLLPERAKRMEHMHKLRRYFREIVYAVSYIHGMNPSLVHRDLKPDNVLLKSNSPNSPCKLIDFGLTTWQAESGEGEDYKVGSLHFMAPELFTKGGGRFTEDMDLFALGVMLYWFLTAVHLGELRHPYADREDVLGELQTPTVYITLYNAYRREEAWRSDALEGFSEDADEMRSILLILAGLLHHDPGSRTRAQCVLSETSWTRAKDPAAAASFQLLRQKGLMSNMNTYQQLSKLDKTILSIVADHACDSDVLLLRRTFRALDEDQDGRLSLEELARGFRANDVEVDEDRLKMLFEDIDRDGSGRINYNEWLTATIGTRLLRSDTALLSAFRVLDTSGKGKISYKNLVAALGEREAQKVMRRTKGGPITFRQFKKLVDGVAGRRQSLKLNTLKVHPDS
eukprot:TRINITY_DN26481_c0_g1_i3.p1 TRINITY_DN26481_c0_g1~~TRINITY_DN26481_c0_g1_i3.p1  ORF type:complete len:674 (+),score=145.67 TRINITY_DN26481_c0_g1_i3:86-2107(+)